MAIVQISQIQQRSGNLVDLPQLNEAEFGWATDTKQLFIGKTTPAENIEVLTSYSNIAFDQITGAVGNLNITASSLSTGEVLAFDGTNWVNAGGNAGGNINLGNVSNLSIGGGAIGYVLQTDGTGNLSWAPKTTLTAYIQDVTKANPAVVTTTQNNYFTKGSAVTITSVPGMTQLNGQVYYVVPVTSNTFNLCTTQDGNTSNLINSSSYTAFPYSAVSNTFAGNSGILLSNSVPFSTGESIQFIGTTFGGIQANTTYYILTNSANVITVSLTPGGNTVGLTTANGTANVYATGGRAISSIGGSGGNSAAAGSNTSIQYNNNNLLAGSASLTYDSANSILTVSNLSVSNPNTGSIFSNNFFATNNITANRISGNLTTNAQPNITSVGTLSSLTVSGNIGSGNVNSNFYGSGSGLTSIPGGNVTGAVAYATTANSVAGANVSGAVAYATTANSVAGANVSGAVAYATTANSVAGGNVTGQVSYAAIANSVAGANVSGAVGLATYATTANAVAGANVSGAVAYATTANSVAGANVSGAVAYATTANSVAGANVSGTVANATYATSAGSATVASSANSVAGANVSGQVSYAATANAVAGANVSGQVGYAAVANSVAGANVSGAVAYATTANSVAGANVSGTVANATYATSAGNAAVANSVAGANVSGAVAYATTANSVAGGNVSGAVGLATYATTANAVAGANVSGAVAYATTANAVAGANVSGQVSYAAVANSVAGANVSGTVSQATTVMGNTQTNINTLNNITTISAGANTTSGTITGNWALSSGSKLVATYADLGEYYSGDSNYEPGTVLMFGGINEVTMAEDGTNRIAGVVSTNPAYVMNSDIDCEYPVVLALQGRVPCKVRGKITKGDMLISGGNGYARPSSSPLIGTVIGKALADYNGNDGIIEIAVGRL